MTQTEAIKKFLEKKYGKQLTDNEVLEHKGKLVEFFSLLIEIDKKQQKEVKDYKKNERS